MQSAAVAATGFTNRGLVDRPNLYVLKHTKMPACLIEYGFISNKTEAARMRTAAVNYVTEILGNSEDQLRDALSAVEKAKSQYEGQ